MGKEEKLSFSLSSKSRPNPSKGPQPFDNQEPTDVSSSKPQFVTAFDPSQTLDSATAPKLVITPIPNYDFRSGGIKRMKNLAQPSDNQHHDPESTRFVVDDSDSTAPADNISFGLTLRSKNASAAAAADSDYKQEDLTLKRFRDDMKSLPDDRGMDEFKDVPVEGFAAAILAGYGWSEGKGIGRKNKGDTKVVQYDRRAGTAGLGYKPSVNDSIVKVQKGREKEYTLNKNAKSPARTVRIISGQYVGLKAEVLKVVDGSELVLKLLNSGKKVRMDDGRVAELGSDAEERCLRKLKLEISDRKEKQEKRMVKDRKEGHSSVTIHPKPQMTFKGCNSNKASGPFSGIWLPRSKLFYASRAVDLADVDIWSVAAADLTIEEMMLDSRASDRDKEERPEIFDFLCVFNGSSIKRNEMISGSKGICWSSAKVIIQGKGFDRVVFHLRSSAGIVQSLSCDAKIDDTANK